MAKKRTNKPNEEYAKIVHSIDKKTMERLAKKYTINFDENGYISPQARRVAENEIKGKKKNG